MCILALVVMAIITASPCFGQEWAVIYGGRGDDIAYSIQQTTDGGYVVAGKTTSSGAGRQDLWVLKLDESGDVTWQKTYGGYHDDNARSIQQTTDGGYVVIGHTLSFGAIGWDSWVLKLDESGDVTWQKTFGVSYSYYDLSYSIQQTTDGGYVVAGISESSDAPDRDSWVLKLDESGDVTWQKTYGGYHSEYARSIQQTTDGGYVVAGVIPHNYPVNNDFWVLKLDESGGITWQKAYGGNYSESAYSIQQTTDGGYVVAGSTSTFGAGGNTDFWVLKLDGSGDVTWQKTYGDYHSEYAHSIQQTTDGGYVVAGFTIGTVNPDLLVLKLDTNGEILGCSLVGDSTAAAIDSSTTVKDTAVTPLDGPFSPLDQTRSPQDSYVGRSFACAQELLPSIQKNVPASGGYGIKIKLKGEHFGDQRTGMFDQQEGYFSFVTFSGTQTLIGTQYPVWSDDKVKVKFKKLFVDEDGDFLQDSNEVTLPMEQISLEDYVLKMNTLEFEDLNTNGIYDQGDNIIGSDSSNPKLFTLTDEPVIYSLIPNPTPASEPGNPAKVKIKGLNFGEPQGTSILHIGGRSWPEGHTKIKIWEDYRIKFKVPDYNPLFPIFKDVWVTVNGKDSNKVQLKITAP